MSSHKVSMDLLNKIIQAFNAHDVEAVGNYFTEDGEMHLAAGPEMTGKTLRGREEICAALNARFSASPDIQWVDGENWIFGNKALSEWRVTGTQPDGNIINTLGCDLWEFDGNLVKKKDTYYKQKT